MRHLRDCPSGAYVEHTYVKSLADGPLQVNTRTSVYRRLTLPLLKYQFEAVISTQ